MTGWWNQLALTELDDTQWEALCDGCARCCMIKLEDEDTGEVHYTDVVCRYLDLDRQRCQNYPLRHELVPDCVPFSVQEASQFAWLPESCAYRKRAHGQPLAWWHPLESGNPQTVIDAGISVRGRVRSETSVAEDELQSHIVRWVQPESNA